MVNKSVTTFCQAPSGNSVAFMGSAWFFRCLQQVGQIFIMSSIWLPRSGHQTDSRPLSRYLHIPWWTAWILSSFFLLFSSLFENSHFSALRVAPAPSSFLSTSWCFACVLPRIRISSMLDIWPSMPSSIIPKGIRLKQNLPNDVIKVFNERETLSSFSWQNPELQSNLDKTLGPLTWLNRLLIVGRGYVSRRTF